MVLYPNELRWYALVPPPGFDPGSSDFQSVAMTTSAKAALNGCGGGIRNLWAELMRLTDRLNPRNKKYVVLGRNLQVSLGSHKKEQPLHTIAYEFTT